MSRLFWMLVITALVLLSATGVGISAGLLKHGCPRNNGLYCNVTSCDGSWCQYSVYMNYSGRPLEGCLQGLDCTSGPPYYSGVSNCSSVNNTHGPACYGKYSFDDGTCVHNCYNGVAEGFLFACSTLLLFVCVLWCVYGCMNFCTERKYQPIV